VDASRTGKPCPDSFNRTVPLWCAVMNALLCPSSSTTATKSSTDNGIHLPPWLAGFKGERDRISSRQISQWVHVLSEIVASLPTDQAASLKTTKRFTPHWILNDFHAYGYAPWTSSLVHFNNLEEEIPIVCVSASATVSSEDHREHFSFAYVPGAGDDEENWCQGLTPSLFHVHQADFDACENSDQVQALIAKLLANVPTPSENGKNVLELAPSRIVMHWGSAPTDVHQCLDMTWLRSDNSGQFKTTWKSKAFPQLCQYYERVKRSEKIIIVTHDDKSAFTLALFLLCSYFDDNFQERQAKVAKVSKDILKKRLSELSSRLIDDHCIDRRLVKLVYSELSGD